MDPQIKKQIVNVSRGHAVVRPAENPNPSTDSVGQDVDQPPAEPSMDQALAARVARLEAVVAAVRDWADAAGVAETILQRDGYASKAYERAAARRDAARKTMLAI